MTPLSKRLTEICNDLKLKPADLARYGEVTDAAVNYWFNAAETMKMETALALQHKTKYRAEWIATGRGAKKLEAPDDEDMLDPAEKAFLLWFRDLTPTEQEEERKRVQDRAEHNREVARIAMERLKKNDDGSGGGR